jgi:hypothetical protein
MGGDIYSRHTGHSISFSVTSSVLDIPVSLASTTGPSDLQTKLQHCQQVQFGADVTYEVFMTMRIHTASSGYDTVYPATWVPGAWIGWASGMTAPGSRVQGVAK